jgi:hypothetical protein
MIDFFYSIIFYDFRTLQFLYNIYELNEHKKNMGIL